VSGRGDILVLNAGSSSVKFAVFDEAMTRTHSGLASEIGGASSVTVDGVRETADLADHPAALAAVLARLGARGVAVADLRAAAHRVVHGGRDLSRPVRIDSDILARIEACVPLAPLHNPHNLSAIRAVAALAPDLPQCASFDTAFHATNPEVALRYAIPDAEEAKGIRRYGFHGTSYAGLVARLPGVIGAGLPDRILALHLGNGASLCAIRQGRSVATTMGYSPLEGLTMGTRAGGIDGNAVLRMVADHGASGAGRILNNESGLLALGGVSDMRALRAISAPRAAFAIDHFCYWALRHAGSMIAAMGGLDAVVFTGGIGENDAGVRAAVLKGLDWIGVAMDARANADGAARLHVDGSRVSAWIVPADEERQIALEARDVLAQ
jgi:acetate kinase